MSRSRELCATLPAVLSETAALMAESRRLCRTRRPISGGSDLDSPFIVEIMAMSRMCVDCLASKTGIPVARIEVALPRIREIMAVTAESARCAGCLQVSMTYCLTDRDAPAASAPSAGRPRPALVTQSEAIWRFLESRRGEMFCTQCVANALFATKRIDRAILGAEGRGARRQHGPCASCGKERLLCGLTR